MDHAAEVPKPLAVLYARSVMLATGMQPEDPALGRTFSYWLATVCHKARQIGGLNQSDIPVNQPMVSRFEKHGRWPSDPEGLVAAYAQALGIKDSRQLWDAALALWIEHGQPPRPIETRRVPGMPEGELLQRLLEAAPNDSGRQPRTSSPEAKRRESG